MDTRLRLLAIDDNDDDVEIILRDLRQRGLELEARRVATVQELKDAFAEPWDLVLSDWSMPGLDGLVAYRIMRELGLDLPFIIVSGTIDEEIAIAALKAGAHDFVNKDKLARLAPAIDRELRDAEVRRRQREADGKVARQLELLAQSEDRYRAMFETSPLPMWTFDRATLRFVAVNDAALHYYGYSRDEMLALTIADLRPDGDTHDLRRVLRAGGGAPSPIWRQRKKDGSIISVEITASDLVVDARELTLVLVNDVTDRERAPPRPIGLWLAVVMIVAIAVLAAASMQRLLGTMTRIDHTHRVIEGVDTIEDRVAVLAASRRGYSLSGDEQQLRGYDQAERDIADALARVRAEVEVDLDPETTTQRRHVDALDLHVSQLLQSLNDALRDRRLRGFDGAREAVHVRESDRAMASLGSLVGELAGTEHALLLEQRDDSQRQATYERIALLGGTLMSLVILWLAFARLSRETRKRRSAEEVARRSEESLATTLLSIGDGVIATDREGRVVRMNPVAERLTGWTMASASRRPFKEVFRIVHEGTSTAASDPVERVIRDGARDSLENDTALVARDGTHTAIAERAAPIRDATGQIAGAVLVFRDATAERAWERRIKEANAFLDSIIENIPNMVFVKDSTELRFVRFNRAGERLLGMNRADLLGKTDVDLFPLDAAQAFQAKDRETLATALLEVVEEQIETPHGRRWLHTKKIPICDDAGTPRFLLGISEDITERKQTADRLRTMNDELERRVVERTAELLAANDRLRAEMSERQKATAALQKTEEQLRQSQKMDAIGRLAGGIAHDFNNLLSVIISYSEMVITESPPGTLHAGTASDVAEIHKAGLRAADLTRQLLAFSRQQVLVPKVLDLNEVVAGIDKLLRRVIGADIELRTVRMRELASVKVDPGQIEQVIMNLVVNARDAMPRGGTLTLETARVELDPVTAPLGIAARGRYIMLAVSDTGTGMTKDVQARVFEPFFTTKEQGKGTGLGLSTVYGIVQQSGGTVWLYSEPAVGTTFKIYLPEVAEKPEVAEPVVRVAPRGSETILLVEDEPALRTLARGILMRAGYQVIEAADGEDALARSQAFAGPIDLVVTDVVMPRMSGRELVERLAEQRPATRVLFMSGYTDDTIVHHGVLDREVAFLQKPITPEALTIKVREVLGGT